MPAAERAVSGPQIPGAPLDPDFINAVCELVAAVFVEHCLPVGTEGHLNEEWTLEAARIVMEKIREAPEFSVRHAWAERLLADNPEPTGKWADLPCGEEEWLRWFRGERP
jgi:hypothetical protein